MAFVVHLGVFVIAWFMSFIVLLPIGLSNDTNEHGAPSNPRLLLKAAIASIAAIVIWGAFYATVVLGFVNL